MRKIVNWGHGSVLRHYDKHRLSTKDVYQSEWFFLKDKLKNNISVLDIGCAKGFMANVLKENLQHFNYIGLDTCEEMVLAARFKFPQHQFFTIQPADYSILNQKQFDLVICLGVLPIDHHWRDTLKQAWLHTKKCLLIDLRETHLTTIENNDVAYFNMNFEEPHSTTTERAPYNIINATDAQKTIVDICVDAQSISHYGYRHPVSELAISPIQQVMANVYCIER